MLAALSPTIISPNGGESIFGNEILITWTVPSGDPTSSLELFFTVNYDPFNDPNWQQIATLPYNATNYLWRFGNALRSNQCRIAIRSRDSLGDRGGMSISANNFSIHRKQLISPSLINPLPNGRYDKFVEIITDDSGIVNSYSQRSSYQFYYSSLSAGIPSTLIAQNVIIGSDPVIWNTLSLPPANDYVLEAYLSDSDGNLSNSTYIRSINIVHEGFFIVDTIAPVASISVNNGDAFTRFREVNVSIVAQDAATGIHSLRLLDQHTVGAPEALTNVKRFVLSDNNEVKSVQLLLQDFGANRNDELQIIQRIFQVIVELNNTQIVDIAIDIANKVCWAVTSGDFKNLYKITDFASLLSTFEDIPTSVAVFQSLPYIATNTVDNKSVVYRFNGGTLELLTAFTDADSTINSMVSYGAKLYIGMENGNIYSFDGLNFVLFTHVLNPVSLLYSDSNVLYLIQKKDLKLYVLNGTSFSSVG
jgi:hypothetical protein